MWTCIINLTQSEKHQKCGTNIDSDWSQIVWGVTQGDKYWQQQESPSPALSAGD